jgi:hypothetical protein
VYVYILCDFVRGPDDRKHKTASNKTSSAQIDGEVRMNDRTKELNETDNKELQRSGKNRE